MNKYPKLDEKIFDRLPQPFKEIIKHDHKKPVFDNVKVVDVKEYVAYKNTLDEWRETKQRLVEGCEKVVTQMKKG